MSTSFGRSRYRESKDPMIACGISTEKTACSNNTSSVQKSLLLLGDPVHLGDDRGLSLGRVHNHSSFFQSLFVGPEVVHPKRTVRREEPMTEGPIAGCQPSQLEPDRLTAVEGQEPADRTREADVRLVPPHGLRKRKTAHQLGEKSGQEHRRRATSVLLHGEKVVASGSRSDFQRS